MVDLVLMFSKASRGKFIANSSRLIDANGTYEKVFMKVFTVLRLQLKLCYESSLLSLQLCITLERQSSFQLISRPNQYVNML